MPYKGRTYTGSFGPKLDAICINNEPPLVASVIEARIKVAYYRRDLAGLPKNEIDDHVCSSARRLHQTIRQLLTECPLCSQEQATIRIESKYTPGMAWVQSVL
jgi:hypothetical protein